MPAVVSLTDRFKALELIERPEGDLTEREEEFLRRLAERWDRADEEETEEGEL
jgi:hypothetical protein